jgi:hypothetical protein
MSILMWGRTERIALTDDDYVVIHDAIGGHLRMPPNAARTLHRELGKFLAASNDAKPLPAPTRADFRSLLARVEKLESAERNREEPQS